MSQNHISRCSDPPIRRLVVHMDSKNTLLQIILQLPLRLPPILCNAESRNSFLPFLPANSPYYLIVEKALANSDRLWIAGAMESWTNTHIRMRKLAVRSLIQRSQGQFKKFIFHSEPCAHQPPYPIRYQTVLK